MQTLVFVFLIQEQYTEYIKKNLLLLVLACIFFFFFFLAIVPFGKLVVFFFSWF